MDCVNKKLACLSWSFDHCWRYCRCGYHTITDYMRCVWSGRVASLGRLLLPLHGDSQSCGSRTSFLGEPFWSLCQLPSPNMTLIPSYYCLRNALGRCLRHTCFKYLSSWVAVHNLICSSGLEVEKDPLRRNSGSLPPLAD